MTRFLTPSCFVLAAVVASVSAAPAIAGIGVAGAGASTKIGTPLPPGWELCVLAGVGAPASQANVADLNEWQAAEGGSTNNTAAYNPFNTARTTNVLGASLPYSSAGGGFPSFPDWLTGCSATVATLLQPNMWAITAALRAGNVAPPGQFLIMVDSSAWCAPSSSGQPCYENAIVASGGSIPGVVAASTALNVYGNVQSDLHAYQLAIVTSAHAQTTQAARGVDVAQAQDGVRGARSAYTQAERDLRSFAVSEYVHSGLYQASAFGTDTGSDTQASVASQQYTKVAAGDLVARVQAQSAALTAAQNKLADAMRGLQGAAAALLADNAAENHALAQLVADLATLQTAGACTSVSIIDEPTASNTPGSGTASPPAGAGGATTTTSATVPAPTTTTSTAPPTTTTSTAPAHPMTTPVSPPAITTPPSSTSTSVPSVSPTTTTTTTTPPTTTTTTQPGSTGGNSSAAAPSPAEVQPAGMGALQGCMSALAPHDNA